VPNIDVPSKITIVSTFTEDPTSVAMAEQHDDHDTKMVVMEEAEILLRTLYNTA
jgi:hypothetical protein